MSKAQKWLLAWSAGLIILAEVIKHLHTGEKTTIAIGVVEVFLAFATGVAFGLTAAGSSD
jgi:hypothetical protein